MKRQGYFGCAWFVLLLGLLVAGAVPRALAEAHKRVAVLEFNGPSATAARKDVVKSLSAQSDLKVLSAKQVDAAARKAGASLSSSSGLARVAQQLHITAFVKGDIAKAGKKGFRVDLTVLDGQDGSELGSESWTRKKPQLKKMGAPALSFLRGAIARGTAPDKRGAAVPEAEAEDVSGSDDDGDDGDDEPAEEAPPPRRRETPVAARDEEPPSQEEGGESPSFEDEPKPAGDRSAKHPALVVQVGLRTMWRTLSYTGNTTLSSYENAAGSPAVNAALSAQWYPGAHVRGDWLSNVGLDLDFDYAIGLKSKDGSRTVSTTAYDAAVGVIGRLPFTYVEPRLRLGYVKQVFDADVASTTQLPGASYSAVRANLGAALFLGDKVTLDAAVGYLIGMGIGELDSSAFAKGASANAIEVGAGLLVAIKEVYGVRLGVDYRRWALDFSGASSRTSTLPSGGSDTYLRTTLAFVYRMPGITK